MFRGNIKRWRSHLRTTSSHSTIVRHTLFLQNLQVTRGIQIRPISLTFHLPTMRSLIYLSALLLLPLPAFGLPSRMNVVNSRQVNNTDTNGTFAASVSSQAIHRRGWIGWWCGTAPCHPNIKRVESGHTDDTAIDDTAANNIGKRLEPPGYWCDTHVCGSRIKSVKKRQIDTLISDASTLS